MAFVLSKKPTFKYAVKVKQARDSGKLEVFEFQREFKRLEQPRIRELAVKPPPDRALLDEVWVGWAGVKALVKQGEDGPEVEQDLPVTPENRELLLREPGVEAALVNAWLDAAIYGPAKN
jgi:hypothetical protein